jgi:hypothetical protein
MLHLTRGLARLRARHPALANGDIGFIPSDSRDWMVFEKFAGPDRYLVLINMTATGQDYKFNETWYPQYAKAQLIFQADGKEKTWKDTTKDNTNIESSVSVPPFGLAVIRQAKKGP